MRPVRVFNDYAAWIHDGPVPGPRTQCCSRSRKDAASGTAGAPPCLLAWPASIPLAVTAEAGEDIYTSAGVDLTWMIQVEEQMVARTEVAAGEGENYGFYMQFGYEF